MEVWDLYDENRNKIGKDWIRGEKIPEGCYHLVVHVWIRNNKGQYLISQRSENRKMHPLMWECTGGSVLKGEESIDGAIRETKEEVGLDLDPSKGKLVLSKIREYFNDIVDVWMFDFEGECDLTKATTDEVKDARWMNKEEIKIFANDGKFIDTLYYFFENKEIFK